MTLERDRDDADGTVTVEGRYRGSDTEALRASGTKDEGRGRRVRRYPRLEGCLTACPPYDAWGRALPGTVRPLVSFLGFLCEFSGVCPCGVKCLPFYSESFPGFRSSWGRRDDTRIVGRAGTVHETLDTSHETGVRVQHLLEFVV